MAAKKIYLRGDRVVSLRRGKYSQEELADLVGASQQQLSKWETGVTDPDAGNLINLASVLGVTVDYLLGQSDDPVGKADVRKAPDLAELLAKAVNQGKASEILEFIARTLKSQE